MLTTWPRPSLGFDKQRAEATALPAWITRCFCGEPEVLVRRVFACAHPAALSMARRGDLVLLRVRHPDADSLSALDFQRATACAYRAIREQLAALSMHPVRFWNVIPCIRTAYGDGLDRYMVFNAGRFAAYTEWHGAVGGFDGALATASGVGYGGADLHVAVLAAPDAGVPVENPRQKRAYHYSHRYGPMPPCFSRGILCAQECGLPSFIVGGTSSVCGEQSAHIGDVAAQTRETLRNIAALIEAAAVSCQQSVVSRRPDNRQRAPDNHTLACLDSLRIYLVNETDEDAVVSIVAGEVGTLSAPVEIVRADICRPDLLVEIEGTATLEREGVGAS